MKNDYELDKSGIEKKYGKAAAKQWETDPDKKLRQKKVDLVAEYHKIIKRKGSAVMIEILPNTKRYVAKVYSVASGHPSMGAQFCFSYEQAKVVAYEHAIDIQNAWGNNIKLLDECYYDRDLVEELETAIALEALPK